MARDITEGNNELYQKYNEKKYKMTSRDKEMCLNYITYLHQLETLKQDKSLEEHHKEIDKIVQATREKVAKILTK